jgi:hypothetical protein
LANNVGVDFLGYIPENNLKRNCTKLSIYDERKVVTMRLINEFSGSDQTDIINNILGGGKFG